MCCIMTILLVILSVIILNVYSTVYDIGVPCGKDQTNYDPWTTQIIIKGTATSSASVLELVLFNDETVELTPLTTKAQTVTIIEGVLNIYIVQSNIFYIFKYIINTIFHR